MHRNAPLTPEGRLRLCLLIEDGWTVAPRPSRCGSPVRRRTNGGAVTKKLVVQGSKTAPAGPGAVRPRLPHKVERRVVELRRRHQLGPARLAPRAGVPASTLHPIWSRHGVSRLSDLERRSGRVIRRIETCRPGELVHVDIKKQAKIPLVAAGGSMARPKHPQRQGWPARLGYAYIHSAIDAYSRLAYSEVHANEQAVTAMAFWRRARAFFASYGITVERVMTDNGSCYRLACLRRRAGGRRNHPHTDQDLLPADQRKSRTL